MKRIDRTREKTEYRKNEKPVKTSRRQRRNCSRSFFVVITEQIREWNTTEREESKVWEPTKVVREKSSSVFSENNARTQGTRLSGKCWLLLLSIPVHHPPRPAVIPPLLTLRDFSLPILFFPPISSLLYLLLLALDICLPLGFFLHLPEHRRAHPCLINISLDPVHGHP